MAHLSSPLLDWQEGGLSKVQFTQRDFDLIELLEVRKMPEPSAASLAAARRDKTQLSLIEHELAQEKYPDDREVLVRYDYLFHEEIMHAANNHILQSVSAQLAPLLLKSRKQTGRQLRTLEKSFNSIASFLR